VVFGTGRYYEINSTLLERNFDILCFFDNDQIKQDTVINNIPVLHPSRVLDFNFDVIFVMSGAFGKVIQRQLLDLGIPRQKIVLGMSIVHLSDCDLVNYVQCKIVYAEKILLACMPKSGSTYIRKAFGALPNFKEVNFVPFYGGREQEICEFTIHRLLSKHENCIAQQHVRYSVATSQVINTFDLKVIVLVRNVFDVVFSIYDHLINESATSPMAFFPFDWNTWERERAYEFIIDMILPWYFNFYASWMNSDIKDNIIFVTYDEFMKNKFEKMNDICHDLEIDVSDFEIRLALDSLKSKKTRKNIGILGRGNALPEVLKEKIRKMSAYYKDMDFSLIGL